MICNSSFTRSDFISKTDYPAHQVSVVYNGVDPVFLQPHNSTLRSQLGISQDATVAVFVGQLSEQKGLHHLLRAMRKISDENIHLIVAGDSTLWQTMNSPLESMTNEYETRLAREAEGLNVHFMGRLASEQLPNAYRAADIMVCPSEWTEPFGIVNIEAMASALPVIASRTGGIPEIVIDNDTGILVEPADADSLANAIAILASDRAKRVEMGRRGQERVEQQFTWERSLGQINDIYTLVQQ